MVPKLRRSWNDLPPPAFDGLNPAVWLRFEAHLANFLVMQTHFSCRFLPAIDFLGLRRSVSSSQIINQAQNFLEQLPWHSNLSQLESDVTTMADDLGTDLDQLFP